MADKKISELVSLAGKDVAATDFFPVVDVSVTETKSLTRDELRNAVNAIQFTATKALATTAAASLPDDTIIEVAADESLSDARTRYKVAAGALVFAVNLDQLEVDLADASDPAKGAALVGTTASGVGMVPRTLAEIMKDTISVKSAGAACDYTTNDTEAIQKIIDAAPAGSTIEFYKHAITGSIYINKALTLKAKSGRAKFIQSNWGYPCFIIHSAADVEFVGDFAFEYVGARTYPIPVPTSTDSRIQAFYALYPGSERILCTSIVVRGLADNFKTGDISSKGFFCGVTIAGNTSNTLLDSKNVRMGVITVDTVDWGVLIGGGVADITIAGITARNIKCTSPGDPSHAIYMGARSAGVLCESMNIGFINLNGVELLAAGENNGDAFSIRSCKHAYIGSVSVLNSRYIGNCRDKGTLTIGVLRADLVQSEVEPITGLAAAISAQSGGSITIMDADITARNNVTSTTSNALFQASSTGSLYIRAGKYKFVGATCGQFIYFGGENLEVGAGVSIEYENPVAATLSGEAAPIYVYDVTGNLHVDKPKVKGSTALLYYGNISAGSAAADRCLVSLDPNLILSGSTQNTVFDSSTKYRIVYSSFARSPSLITNGATQCVLQGRNTVITGNTASTLLSVFSRGSDNQRYLILAGDALTGITHGNFASGFVAKGAASIAAGSWKAVEAIWLTDRLYEIARV